jgi:RNA polymerase sigma-70 factor (ECF subfamily)
VATLTRLLGDLEAGEDAVQDACALALTKWPAEGVPANPRAWLIGVARHKAVDRMRRERRRAEKEAEAVRDLGMRNLSGAGPHGQPSNAGPGMRDPSGAWPGGEAQRPGLAGPEEAALAEDQLGLVFACCHPALDSAVRVALTLRSVCGLGTSEIAAAFLVPEPTMAQRLVRAKRKIRQAGISLRPPGPADMAERLGTVLRVVYLVFTQGHMAAAGEDLIRGDLCDQAVGLARALAVLMPGEPEVTGLLALLLLTDARRGARIGADGDLVLLADQDRGRWDRAKIAEGDQLLEGALRARRPGPYQLHAAIAACHSCAATAEQTDWRQIAALYGQLVRYEPTPVIEANRAVAVAMADGPAAGLAILDAAAAHPQLARWPQFHIARAELLRRTGRVADALDAYRAALRLDLPAAEHAFIEDRVEDLTACQEGNVGGGCQY